MDSEIIKGVIINDYKDNTLFSKNKDWVSERLEKINSTSESEFYCIEMLQKYGDFNDIIFHVFENKKELEEFKKNSKEKCADTKWRNSQYFSDGSLYVFYINL